MLEDGKVIFSFVAFTLKQIGTIKFSEICVKPLVSLEENKSFIARNTFVDFTCHQKCQLVQEPQGCRPFFS